MIRSGVTCFADMYYFEDAIAEATAAAGMRALCAQTVLRFPTPDATSYEESLALAREFIQRWRGHPLIVPAPAPHAPYTCTPEILRACAELAVEFDVPLHIHLSETALEVDDSRRHHGMPVVPWVKKHGLFDAKVLAAHCVHVDDGEMRALKNANAGVAHNPTSNLKLGAGVAPVARMLELGVDVGIGTDGAGLEQRSRHVRGDAAGGACWRRARAAIRRPSRRAPPWPWRRGSAPPRCTWIDVTGSLEPGKRADLIVLDLDRLHNVPAFGHDGDGIYSRIVYASKSTDVVDVMCNGRWLMRDRALLTLDEEELREAARTRSRRASTCSWRAARSACCRSSSPSAAPSSRRASKCRSRRASRRRSRFVAF